MKVLVACEYSGVVRDAFLRAGHNAFSCDLLPCESKEYGGPHLEGDVRWWLPGGDSGWDDWDMMIAFPPCTYLCSSGLHWNKRRPERATKTRAALAFVKKLLNAPIPRIALENPIGCISTEVRKPDQIIHPWQFGHAESKSTCLWLKGLPPLRPTNVLTAQRVTVKGTPRWDNQTASGQNKHGPSDDRWKTRSITYLGVAQAMVDQWGAS